MTLWMAINTAPKDGRRIINAYFDGAEWRYGVARWINGVWFAGRVDGEAIFMSSMSTHWCDVPEPPCSISEKLVAGISAANVHEETETGPAVGNEFPNGETVDSEKSP